jgi:hypothetical protein
VLHDVFVIHHVVVVHSLLPLILVQIHLELHAIFKSLDGFLLRGVDKVRLVVGEVVPWTLIQKGVQSFNDHNVMMLSKEKGFLLFRILRVMVECGERFNAFFLGLMKVVNELLRIICEWSSSTSISLLLVLPCI